MSAASPLERLVSLHCIGDWRNDFEQMDEVQKRLHNAALVLEAEGYTNGFPKLHLDAIAYIERLKTSLNKVQKELSGLAKGDLFMHY